MAVVIALGEWRDALFGFVMILNLVIGVVQEWRAKTTLDRLSLVSRADASRSGATAPARRSPARTS